MNVLLDADDDPDARARARGGDRARLPGRRGDSSRRRAQGRLHVHGRPGPRDEPARDAGLHRGLELRQEHEVVGRSPDAEGPRHQPRGRHVIIVEDIVDTGLTLTYLQDILRARAPKTLRTACLLSKPSRRQVDVTVEYIGFTIEDQFVVGYGLDYAEKYRNLPYIAVLEQDEAIGAVR